MIKKINFIAFIFLIMQIPFIANASVTQSDSIFPTPLLTSDSDGAFLTKDAIDNAFSATSGSLSALTIQSLTNVALFDTRNNAAVNVGDTITVLQLANFHIRIRVVDPTLTTASLTYHSISSTPENSNDAILSFTLDVDNDRDGISATDDSDDNDPWTDFDGDGFTDRFEFAMRPHLVDANAATTDADNDNIIDIWTHIENNGAARAALINEEWHTSTAHADRFEQKLNFIPPVNSQESVDLSNLTTDATFEFIVHVETDYFNQILLMGDSTGNGLGFESGFNNRFSVHDGSTQYDFFSWTIDRQRSTMSRYGKTAHVTVTFDDANNRYRLFVNGRRVGERDRNSFDVFTNASASLGLIDVVDIANNQLTSNSSIFSSKDGLYAFSAYSSALTQPEIADRADAFLSVISDSDGDGVWDQFDLDKDGDGLALPTDSDDEDKLTDSDGDGLLDVVESSFQTHVYVNSTPDLDLSTFTTDSDDNKIIDVWDELSQSDRVEPLAAYALQEWFDSTTHTDREVVMLNPIQGYQESYQAPTVDLSVLPVDNVTYEFLVYVKGDVFSDITLLGRSGASDTLNATSLKFEQKDKPSFTYFNEVGIHINNHPTQDSIAFTSTTGTSRTSLRSPYGKLSHLVFTFSGGEYTLFIDGVKVGTATDSNGLMGVIKDKETPIGLINPRRDPSGAGARLLTETDGIYGFVAYATVLPDDDIADRAATVPELGIDSDRDSVWNAFDLNAHKPSADYSNTPTGRYYNSFPVIEDQPYTFKPDDFPYIDEDNDPSSLSIVLDRNVGVAYGQLFFDGNDLATEYISTRNKFVIPYNELDKLVFHPNENYFRSRNFNLFYFYISDGEYTSSRVYMRVTITEVPDPPAATDTSSTIKEDEIQIIASNLTSQQKLLLGGYSDVDRNALTLLRVTQTPANAELRRLDSYELIDTDSELKAITATTLQSQLQTNGLVHLKTSAGNHVSTVNLPTTPAQNSAIFIEVDSGPSFPVNVVTPNDTYIIEDDEALSFIFRNGNWDVATDFGTLVNQNDEITATSQQSLVYRPLPNYSGPDSFLWVLEDDGSADNQSIPIQHTFNITNINDLPVLSVPMSGLTADEDIPFPLSGISVQDNDQIGSGGEISTVSLSVTKGQLNVSLSGSASIIAGANGTESLVLSGSEADINATLANLTYLTELNDHNSTILTVEVTDLAGESDSANLPITVNSAHDDPEVRLTNVSQQLTRNVITQIDRIQVFDPDGTESGKEITSVDLSVSQGTLSVNTSVNVTVTNNGGNLKLEGTEAAINASLTSLHYLADATATGIDTLTVEVQDASVSPGSGRRSESMTLVIIASNNAPMVTLTDTSVTINENNAETLFGVSVSDLDDGDANYEITEVEITADTGGTLNVSLSGSASIIDGANDTNSFKLSGSETDLNNTLSTLRFTPDTHFHGDVTVTIMVKDADGASNRKPYSITVNSISTQPEILISNLPASIDEDALTDLQTIQVADGDGNQLGEGIKDIVLTVQNGLLNVTETGNVDVENNNSKSLKLKGNETDINDILTSLKYQSDTNYYGPETLDVLVSDHAGLTASDSRSIPINSINDDPVVEVDFSQFIIREGSNYNCIDASNFNFYDPDGNEPGKQLVKVTIDSRMSETGNSVYLASAPRYKPVGIDVDNKGANRWLFNNSGSGGTWQYFTEETVFTPESGEEDNFEQNLDLFTADISITRDNNFCFRGEDFHIGFFNVIFLAEDAAGAVTKLSVQLEQINRLADPTFDLLNSPVSFTEGDYSSTPLRIGDFITYVSTDENGSGMGRPNEIQIALARRYQINGDYEVIPPTNAPHVTAGYNYNGYLMLLKLDDNGSLQDLINAFHDTQIKYKEGFNNTDNITIYTYDEDGEDSRENLQFDIQAVSNGFRMDYTAANTFVGQDTSTRIRNLIPVESDTYALFNRLADHTVEKFIITANNGVLTIPDAENRVVISDSKIKNTVSSVNNALVYEYTYLLTSPNYYTVGTLTGSGTNQLTLTGLARNPGDNPWRDYLSTIAAFEHLITPYLTYTPTTGFSGDDTLVIEAIDYDGTVQSFPLVISVGDINDPPSINITTPAFTVDEDDDVDITGLSVDDPDTDPQFHVHTVTFSASNGQLILPFAIGINIRGNYSNYLEVNGTKSAINDLIKDLLYRHPPNESGNVTLDVSAYDGLNSVNEALSITINSVNDLPSVSAPNLPSEIDEDIATSIVGVTVFDADGTSAEGITELTISVQNGTLDFGIDYTNLTNIGLDTNTLTLVYNQNQLNGMLPKLVYTPPSNFSGQEELTFTVKDQTTESDLIHRFNIKPVNDDPEVVIALSKTDVDEEKSLQLDGISVTDGDLDAANKLKSAVFSLTAGKGTLTFSSTTNLIETGNGTDTVKLEGDQTDIAAALTNLVFEPAPGFNGSLTLTVTGSDGGINPATQLIDLTVNAVNNPPEITLVSPSFTIKEDEIFQLTGISVADHDRENEFAMRLETVTFEVNLGTLSFDPVAGLTIENNISNLVTLKRDTNPSNTAQSSTALPDLINTALANLSYQGYENRYGPDTLTITALDAAPTDDKKSIAITLTSENDPPELTLNSVPTQTTEDVMLVMTGISVSDGDVNDVDLSGNPTVNVLDRVELTVDYGTLTMGANTGSAVITDDNSGSVIVEGTQADINAVFAAISYQGGSNYSGQDTLTITAYDGATGTDTKSLTIDIAGINDDPVVNLVRLTETIDEDNSLAINDFSVDEQDGDRLTDGFKELVLSANKGIITLIESGGATAKDNRSQRVVLSGLLQDVNDTLRSFIYQPDEHHHDQVTLTLRAEDQVGAFDVKTVSVIINSVNDLPQIQNIPNLTDTVTEDGIMPVSQTLGGVQYDLTVQDPDTDTNHVLDFVLITTQEGILEINATAPLGVSLIGSGSGTIRIEDATPAQVNSLLASLTFSPNADYVGPAVIDVTVQDMAPEVDTQSLNITVTEVNDPPVVTINLALDTFNEDLDFPLSFMSVTDVDDGKVGFELTSAQVSVDKGILIFSNGSAVTNNNTNTVTINGNQTDINNVLSAGLVHRGDPHANGDVTLTLTADDGIDPVTETKTLTITPVNDTPVWTIPATPIDVTEDTKTKIVGVSLLDPDGEEIAHRLNQVTLAVNNGTLSIQGATDLTISDNDTANVTLTGTAQAIMDAVQSIDYEPNLNFNGSDRLVMTAVDADNSVPQTLDISVASDNDPPLIAGDFTDRSVNEDTPFNLVSVNTPLSVSDVDVGEAANEITSVLLTVNNGELSVASPVSSSSRNVPGSLASITLTGTEDQINQDLLGLVYEGDDNFFGPDTFTISAIDPNTSVSQTITINVASVNDEPEITATQTTYSVNEDAPLILTGLSVVDFDEVNPLHGFGTLVIAAQNGILTATPSGASQIADDKTASITLTGTHQDITQTLTTLSYQGTDHFHGTDTVTLTATDSADTEDTAILTITVDSVNDAPDVVLNNVPNSTNEDTPLALTGLSVLDVDDGEVQLDVNGQVVVDQNGQAVVVNSLEDVVLTVSNGTLSIANQNTITPAASLTLTGYSQSVSNLLSNLVYTPNPNFEGTVQLDIVATDQAGTTDTPSHTITVTSVNDKPVISIGAMPSTVKEDEVLDLDAFRVADNDETDTANTNKLGTVTLNVSNGTLTLTSVAGLIESGNGTASVTLTGTETDLNAALSDMSYQGNSDYHGSDQLVIRATDNDPTVPSFDENTFDISVLSVNDITPSLDAIRLFVNYDNPLRDDDTVSLSKSSLRDLAENIANNGTYEHDYVWQSSTNLSDPDAWSDVIVSATPQAYAALTPLTLNHAYRMKLVLRDPVSGDEEVVLSDETIAVSPLDTSGTGTIAEQNDFNLVVDPLAQPRVGQPMRLHSELFNADGSTAHYTNRQLRWFVIDRTQSVPSNPAGTADTYTPVTADATHFLRVEITYYDGADAILQTHRESLVILDELTDTALSDLLAELQDIRITPHYLSPSMTVSLDENDLYRIEQSSLTPTYRWYKGDEKNGYNEITSAPNSPEYLVDALDAGSRIYLELELAGTENNTLLSNVTDTVQDTRTINIAGAVLEPLYIYTDGATLSLVEDSQLWLAEFASDNGATPQYQWYRIPENGDVDRNGDPLGQAVTQTLDTTADIGYQHQLIVTLDINGTPFELRSNKTDVVFSDPVDPTNPSNAPFITGINRGLYKDVVTITTDTTPAQEGEVVTASLTQSRPSRSVQPPSVTYVWERSATPADENSWTVIPSATSAQYTITAADVAEGYIRVKAERSDAMGVIFPELVSTEEAVEAASSLFTSAFSWTVELNTMENIPFNTLLRALHREPVTDSTRDETVRYQWFKFEDKLTWDERIEITGETNQTLLVQSGMDLDNHHIGVMATIEDRNSNEERVAESNLIGAVRDLNAINGSDPNGTTPTSNEGLIFSADLIHLPYYQNSVVDYRFTLIRDGEIDGTISKEDLTANWYLIPNKAAKDTRSLWTPIDPVNPLNLNGTIAGQFVLLELTLQEGLVPIRKRLISNEILSSNKPNVLDAWFSLIDMKPKNVVVEDSTARLLAQPGEFLSPSLGGYTTIYNYAPVEDAEKIYTTFADFWANESSTSSHVMVYASQSDSNNERELTPQIFAIDTDLAYEVRMLKPVLDVESQLHSDSTIGLLNRAKVDAKLAEFVSNTGLTPYFQWYERDVSTGNWAVKNAPTPSFEPLTPLNEGSDYYLEISATNPASGVKAYIDSEPSNVVLQSATDASDEIEGVRKINYDIQIEPLLTPKVGLPLFVVPELVRADGTPVPYKDRVISWMLSDDEHRETQTLGTGHRFMPSPIHVGQSLRARVQYFGLDATGLPILLTERSIDSPLVEGALTETDLSDLIVNLQPIDITPDAVSPNSRVALALSVHDAFRTAQLVSNVQFEYQWLQITDSGTQPIPNENNYFYVVREEDQNTRLQLSVTLTLGSETETLYSNKTHVVQDTSLDLTYPLYLTFDPATITYSLTQDSKDWLAGVESLTGATIDYQWYRIPKGGVLSKNGLALGSGETQQLVSPEDEHFFHQARITLSNNDGVIELETNESPVWTPTDRPDTNHAVELNRDFYRDVLLIRGGSVPANPDQTLTAVLKGSNLSKNALPPQVDYQWWISTDNQQTWTELQGENRAHLSVITAYQGFVKVVATYIDALGVMEPLEASREVVLQTGQYLTDWSVSIAPIENMPVGQILRAKHRAPEPTNNESVTYQWYRLRTPYDWATRVALSGADHTTYVVTTEDVGHYLVVEATLDDGMSTNVAKSLPVGSTFLDLHREPITGAGVEYAITNLQVSPDPIYDGDQLSGRYGLLENFFLKVDEPLQSIHWYAVADPNDLYRQEEWEAISDGLVTSSQANQYIIMEVVHAINGQKVRAADITDGPVIPGINPIDDTVWPSDIIGTPNPLNRLSVMDVVAKTDENGVLLESGDPTNYAYEYEFISAVTGKVYEGKEDGLASLTDAPDEENTKAVTVRVRQSDINDNTVFRYIKEEFPLANSRVLNEWLDNNEFELALTKYYLYPNTPFSLVVRQKGAVPSQTPHLSLNFSIDGEPLVQASPLRLLSEETAAEFEDIDREIPISVVITNTQNDDRLSHELKGFTPRIAALPSPTLQYVTPFTLGTNLSVQPAYITQLENLLGAENIRGYQLTDEAGMPVDNNRFGSFEMIRGMEGQKFYIEAIVNLDGSAVRLRTNLSPEVLETLSASDPNMNDYYVFGGITGNVGTGNTLSHDLRLYDFLTATAVTYDSIALKWFLLDDPQELKLITTAREQNTPIPFVIGAVTDDYTVPLDANNKYVLLEGEIEKDSQTYVYHAISDLITLNDSDGDGVPDDVDVFPNNPDESVDTDLDGIGDNADIESVNIVPVAVDDEYAVEPNGVYVFEPLLNDFDGNEDDTIRLNNALMKFGEVVILDDNQIQVTLPDVIPQEWYITYQIVDDFGALATGVIKLMDTSSNNERPEFSQVNVLNKNATGLFTRVDLDAPNAVDAFGRPVLVSLLDGAFRMRPGVNVIFWEAKDMVTGLTRVTGQRINIFPQIELRQQRDIYEGGEARVEVHLNGPSPVYPVEVPVSIQVGSTADENDHSLISQTVVSITSGHVGLIGFSVYTDNELEGDEHVILAIDDTVNRGNLYQLTLTVKETFPDHEARAQVINASERVQKVVSLDSASNQFALPDGEQLGIYAEIFHPSLGVMVENTWTHIPPVNTAPLASFTTMNEEVYLLPNTLSVGTHIFELISKATGSIRPAKLSRVVLRVLDAEALSNEADADMDGISDAIEGQFDDDGDLIPDYLDATSECELQVLDNTLFASQETYGGFVLQSEAGTCVKLGLISQYKNTYSPMVDVDVQEDMAVIAPDTDFNADYTGSNLINFTVTDIPNDRVTVVIPLKTPIAKDAIYRKYTLVDNDANGDVVDIDRDGERDKGWRDFVDTADGDEIRSAKGEYGFCPAPHTRPDPNNPEKDAYTPGLTAGHYCIELTMIDGGVYDTDGEINGNIDDPGYVFYPKTNFVLPDISLSHDFEASSQEIKVSFDLCSHYSDCQDLTVVSSSMAHLISLTAEGTMIDIVLPNYLEGEQPLRLILQNSGSDITAVMVNIDLQPYTLLAESPDDPTRDTQSESLNEPDEQVKGGAFSLLIILLLMVYGVSRIGHAAYFTKWY